MSAHKENLIMLFCTTKPFWASVFILGLCLNEVQCSVLDVPADEALKVDVFLIARVENTMADW